MQVLEVAGGTIRQRRRALGLSAEDVANRMAAAGKSVHPDVIYKLERGERRASAETLDALAAALGCRPKTLQRREPTATDVAKRLDDLIDLLRRHGITEETPEPIAA